MIADRKAAGRDVLRQARPCAAEGLGLKLEDVGRPGAKRRPASRRMPRGRASSRNSVSSRSSRLISPSMMVMRERMVARMPSSVRRSRPRTRRWSCKTAALSGLRISCARPSASDPMAESASASAARRSRRAARSRRGRCRTRDRARRAASRTPERCQRMRRTAPSRSTSPVSTFARAVGAFGFGHLGGEAIAILLGKMTVTNGSPAAAAGAGAAPWPPRAG